LIWRKLSDAQQIAICSTKPTVRSAVALQLQRLAGRNGHRWWGLSHWLAGEWEAFPVSHVKQASKRKTQTKAVTVLGVAGVLSLAGGASGAAVNSTVDTSAENTAPLITLGEEEISDVSLTTFYVFDNENAGVHRPGLQLARKRSHGGGKGCAVNRGCGGCGGCGGCASGGGPDGL
jgi:hypothetical protein